MGKTKKGKSTKHRKVVAVYDEEARKEYITGFRKRKQERRAAAAAAIEEKQRKQRLEERKARREALKELAERLPTFEDVIDEKKVTQEEVTYADAFTSEAFGGDEVTVTTSAIMTALDNGRPSDNEIESDGAPDQSAQHSTQKPSAAASVKAHKPPHRRPNDSAGKASNKRKFKPQSQRSHKSRTQSKQKRARVSKR